MCRSRHYFRNRKQVFIKYCFILLSSFSDSFTKVIGNTSIFELKFLRREAINLKIFTFGALIVDFGKEKSVCVFMFIITLVVFIYFCLCIFPKNVLGNLMIIGLKIINKIFENVCFVSLEMYFQKHVMRNHNRQRYPIQRTFFNTRLKQVRMVTYLLQSHQHVHHSC